MNKKQLAIICLLCVIAVSAGISIYNKKSSSWVQETPQEKLLLLPELPVNDIAQIKVAKADTTITLQQKDDGWKVAERFGYPANFDHLSELLLVLRKSKIVRDLDVGPSQHEKLELVRPEEKRPVSGTTLDFTGKDGSSISSLLLGKEYMKRPGDDPEESWPAGRYIMLPGKSEKVFVVSDPLSTVDTKPTTWCQKDFFKVEKTKRVAVVTTNAENTWTLVKDGETIPMKFENAKPGDDLDPSKTGGVAFSLAYASFDDVADPTLPPAVTGLDKPIQVTMETFDNFTYTIHIGSKTNNQYYFQAKVDGNIPEKREAKADEKPEDKERLDKEFKEQNEKLREKLKKEKELEKWIYMVSHDTIFPLLKERTYFFKEKEEFNTNTLNPADALKPEGEKSVEPKDSSG